MLPELLSQIPLDEDIATVTADGAYDTRKCHDTIAKRGAAAIIPPRKNAKPWEPDTEGAIVRNEALRARVVETVDRLSRQSRVETKMHCVKLLGDGIMARDLDPQVAELQIRADVINRFTALGIPKTIAVVKS